MIWLLLRLDGGVGVAIGGFRDGMKFTNGDGGRLRLRTLRGAPSGRPR